MADVALAGREFGTALRRRWGLHGNPAALLAAEGGRRGLWLPAFFGAGIALYFALTIEPSLWIGPAETIVFAALAIVLRRRRAAFEAAVALTVAAAGFAAIQGARWQRDAPMLQRRLGPVEIVGRVVDIDALDRGWRLVVVPDSLTGLTPAEQPRRVRVHIPPSSDPLSPGDRVVLKAMLYPVPGQIVPGSRDFQRDAYFAEIGGVGYSYGGARRLDPPAEADGWGERLRRLRTGMERRITTVLPGSTGGIAAALITGKRGAVAETVKQSFRDSGLSHLLAIAGLHLGLVAGFVFFTVRGGLALVPPVALRYPIKKIAAAITLAVLVCYLLISGAAIPTERAFVMNGVVFAAILLDRLRLSMRICAIAAAVVLVIDPGSLVGPSFQMSFSAVVALIAVYETWGGRLGRLLHGGSIGRRALGYCGGVVVTTVVATLGTDPFSIYHFHRLALYSPLANVVAVPLSAVWTLPWGVVACLLMPFGLERLALEPMGWGIDVTIWVAGHVSALPGDVWTMPRLATGGLVAIAIGGLWLCLWRGTWRLWGLVGIVAGLATMALTRPPDVVIAEFGRFVAARAPDGNYRALGGSGEKIDRSLLAEATGEEMLPWPGAGELAVGGLACAADSCSYEARGRKVAIVTAASGVPTDCGGLDAIVSQVPAGFRCRFRIPVADRIDNWRRGAIALWLDPGGVAIASANESRGDRPWVPHPISARERARLNAAR